MLNTFATIPLLFVLTLGAAPGPNDWITRLGGSVERSAHGTRVSLRGTWVSDAELGGLVRTPRLTELDLSHTHITDDGMALLRDLRTVTEFELRYAEWLGDTGVTHLRGWKNLRRLDLRGTQITDGALAVIGSLPRLEALDVGFARLTDAGMAPLGKLSELRELTLGGNKVTDLAVELVRSFPRLQVLDLSGRQRTDSGMWQVALTDAGMDPIASLRDLRRLNLAGLGISASGLKKLVALNKVQILDLHDCKRVGDDAVAALSALKGLRWLDLSGTAMTPTGLVALRKALPRAEILND